MRDYFSLFNMLLFYIIIALILGSAGSIGLASLLLYLDDDRLSTISAYLLSLAGGTLLGAAFLGMLPKAISLMDNDNLIFYLVLIGISFFFILEKVVLWRTCGNKDCERHKDAAAPLILLGDAFHNFIDGIIITTAFFASYEFGILITLSVIAHEIPQELADFGILIQHGYSRTKALFYNMLSGFSTIIGGLIAYFALESANKLIPYILSISAASFIYIALADLVPQMHKKTDMKDSFKQVGLIITGILIIFLIKYL